MSLVASLVSGAAFASDYYKETTTNCNEQAMRAALDRATYNKRAVITIVECDNGVVKTTTQPRCNTCGCGETKEEVVKREYFVRETVQQYKPVVTYVPAGTYTRVKPACNHGC